MLNRHNTADTMQHVRPPDVPARGTVLVVDDDRVILRTATAKLKAAGYAVLTATDGSSAIGVLAEHSPNVILLDFNFPPDVANGGINSWDGVLIMNWLARFPAAAQAHFIFITGEDESVIQSRLVSAPRIPLFRKPLDFEALLATIEKLVAPASQARA